MEVTTTTITRYALLALQNLFVLPNLCEMANSTIPKRTGRKNDKWTVAEKDCLIDFMLDRPDMDFRSKRVISLALSGFTMPGRSTSEMTAQIMYMVKRVRQVSKTLCDRTGQGTLAGEIHVHDQREKEGTHGYNRLRPLVIRSLALLNDDDPDEEHGEPGTSANTRRLLEQSAGEYVFPICTMDEEDIPNNHQPAVDGQSPPVGNSRRLPSPVVHVTEQPPPVVRVTGPTPQQPAPILPTATTPAPPRVPVMTRAPRRIGQCASVLQELRGVQERQDDLFLATDATRRDRLELKREQLRVRAANLELRRSRLQLAEKEVDLEHKKWEKEVEIGEKKWEKEVEMEEKRRERAFQMEERRMQLEEKKLAQDYELEKKRLELEGKKL